MNVTQNLPFNGLDQNLAVELVENYLTSQGAAPGNGTSATGAPNFTRAVWFSLAQVQSFLAQIQNFAANNALGLDASQLGIRAYFGTYPAATPNDPSPAFNPFYAGMDTVFFVATYNPLPTMDDTQIANDTDSNTVPDAFWQQHKAAAQSIDFDPNMLDANGNPMSWPDIYANSGGAALCMLNHGGIVIPVLRPKPHVGTALTGADALAGPDPLFMNYADSTTNQSQNA